MNIMKVATGIIAALGILVGGTVLIRHKLMGRSEL